MGSALRNHVGSAFTARALTGLGLGAQLTEFRSPELRHSGSGARRVYGVAGTGSREVSTRRRRRSSRPGSGTAGRSATPGLLGDPVTARRELAAGPGGTEAASGFLGYLALFPGMRTQSELDGSGDAWTVQHRGFRYGKPLLGFHIENRVEEYTM